MVAAPIGYSSLPLVTKDVQKVKAGVVTPGNQTDYTDNAPATNNAVRANAPAVDFSERVHDMGVGMQILPPVLTKGATAGAGGTFAAATYFWKVTALGDTGETLGSNEITAVIALNGTQTMTWAAVAGAVGYRVYRGTAADVEGTRVISLGKVLTYTDTGIAGTANAVPVAGNALSAVQGDGGF